MFSMRTTNSECNNDPNPYGFHLSDGVIYIYKNGHEYTDIYGAWDWYLTPGSTVDHVVNYLACNRVQFYSILFFYSFSVTLKAGNQLIVHLSSNSNPVVLDVDLPIGNSAGGSAVDFTRS